VIFGGKDEDNEKLNDVWSFDLVSNTWEVCKQNTIVETPGVPLPRSGHSASLYG
jgi:hypothetical protein